jgi:hypothetical protein
MNEGELYKQRLRRAIVSVAKDLSDKGYPVFQIIIGTRFDPLFNLMYQDIYEEGRGTLIRVALGDIGPEDIEAIRVFQWRQKEIWIRIHEYENGKIKTGDRGRFCRYCFRDDRLILDCDSKPLRSFVKKKNRQVSRKYRQQKPDYCGSPDVSVSSEKREKIRCYNSPQELDNEIQTEQKSGPGGRRKDSHREGHASGGEG